MPTITTTIEALEKIIELDPDIDAQPFIEDGISFVTDVCGGSSYTDDKFERITRYISAHFYCLMDPRTQSEGVKGITARYEGQTGKYLEFTRYGQMAMLLDTDGNLKTLNDTGTRVKAGIWHLGNSVLE